MRIASFNINGVVRRLPNLLAWLEAAEPDVVCLQELKATDAQFPRAAIEAAGYGAVWRGQASWNGVAILARGAEPILTRDALPGDPLDAQSRYIEAAAFGVIVTSIYAPNGNPQPGPKFDYKLAWHERLRLHAADLLATGAPVALVGDYNVVPEPRDIYPTRSYDDNALVQPQSRAAFRRLLDQGWTDALRAAAPGGGHLYLLGLPPQPLAAQRRAQARPPALEPGPRPATDRRRGRSRGARPGGRERPRAGLGGARRLSPVLALATAGRLV